jgi:transcriptional regulator with XRE-family HTH domain
MTVFSKQLEKETSDRGWSQADVAERVGTSQQNVQRWIAGANLPKRKWLIPIANAFGQNPDDWLAVWNKAAMEEGEADKIAADDRAHAREVEKLRKEVRRLSDRVERLAQQ